MWTFKIIACLAEMSMMMKMKMLMMVAMSYRLKQQLGLNNN